MVRGGRRRRGYESGVRTAAAGVGLRRGFHLPRDRPGAGVPSLLGAGGADGRREGLGKPDLRDDLTECGMRVVDWGL